ncbi:hypothetical protein [Turicibacter sanguinis]|uniref:hypothetical protein n=1 Tax=Turicibacter sanguinis TaxID=154288 RepID=UPI0021D4DC8D|nr:hypothetical protein [Turicibacter sanguinis]MCU7190357.1 hypothetical protein [Turicibacter sanguinis]
MDHKKQNLNISSKLHLVGGDYKKVHISGSGTLSGDLNCDTFQTSGKANLEGNLLTNQFYSSGKVLSTGALSCQEEIKVSGKACFEKSVTAKEIIVSGILESFEQISGEKVKVSGRVRAKSMKADEVFISGSMNVQELLQAQELTVSGWLNVSGGIEVEQIKVAGHVSCEGLLSGESVRLEAMSGSTFKEIGATEVEIMRSSMESGMTQMVGSLLNTLMGGLSPLKKVSGELIEADTISVEYAKISKISGHDIIIGPNCVIDEIEYSGSLSIDESSVVHHQVMV